MKAKEEYVMLACHIKTSVWEKHRSKLTLSYSIIGNERKFKEMLFYLSKTIQYCIFVLKEDPPFIYSSITSYHCSSVVIIKRLTVQKNCARVNQRHKNETPGVKMTKSTLRVAADSSHNYPGFPRVG